ncbi:MAG: sugar-transfer associated ATP-grasp domain-containing protein [Bacteroidota bacterium]
MQLSNWYKRTLYLGYYAKQMDWAKFKRFLRFAQQQTNRSRASLWLDSVRSVYRYNIGWIDYFYFRFYEKTVAERENWMGTGYKYEYDLVMNPVGERHILQNKIEFFAAFAPFIKHAMCRIVDIELNNEAAQKVLQNASGKIAIKDALGQCGWDVEIVKTTEMSTDELLSYMEKKGFNMAEEFIVQHPDLSRLSAAGLNTVRLITQINANGKVDIIGPTLRLTVNSAVDNMAMGNIAAPIDPTTGQIIAPGAYQDITKTPEDVHPVTGVPLVGYQVPFWSEVLELCQSAALSNTNNKSIGWDVAITKNGPSLLEGNHNWCKLLWQLPRGKGLKQVLEQYRPMIAAN